MGERIEELEDEIERLRALSQNNAHSWDAIVRERDALRAQLAEAAAFLERLAGGLARSAAPYTDKRAAEARAMARKLRGET